MPSRLTVLKPASEIVTEYVPGRRSTTRYCPVASVVTDRTFSIRTGLATSTVTPGSTPPDVSLTRPVIAACAKAAAGKSNNTDSTATDRVTIIDIMRLLAQLRDLLEFQKSNCALNFTNRPSITCVGRSHGDAAVDPGAE